MLAALVLALMWHPAQRGESASAAAQNPPRGKAVIVVLHGVSWEELAAADAPALKSLLGQAAVGVMNSGRLDAPGQWSAYVTIGAGRRALASPQVEFPAWSVRGAGPREFDIAGLLAANRRARTQAEPGLLGTLLRAHGLRTGLLAESIRTRETDIVTPSVALVMDGAGVVDWVASSWWAEQALTLGRAWRESDLLVVDMYQLTSQRAQAPGPGRPDPRALADLTDLSIFFDEISRTVDTAHHLLIIVSPTCPPYRAAGHMAFAPIAIIGPGFGPGLLTSPSTRRRGVIANTDLAPTVLHHFGIEAPRAGREGAGMSGRIAAVAASDQPLREALALSRRGVRLMDLQWRLGAVYVLGQFAILLGAAAGLVFAPGWARRWRRGLRLIILLGLSLPLALLFVGPLDAGGAVQPYLTLAALAAAFTWLAWRGATPLGALGALLTATAAVIVLDAITGQHLLADSMINFTAISGSRFYGIGNQTMGALVAAAAIGAAALAQEAPRRAGGVVAGWFALVTIILAAPWWGANWGGGVAAAFGLTVAWLGMRSGGPRLRQWAAGLAPAAVMGAMAFAVDLLAGRHGSHIGDSARLVGAGGWSAAWDIIARKAYGHLRVVAAAPYALLTLPVIAGVWWLLARPRGRLRQVLQQRRVLWAGAMGATAAAAAAVVVNDSGVIAAAAAMGVTTLAIAYVALEEGGGAP